MADTNELTISFPIERNPHLLQEYGRAMFLTTNVENFLKNKIEKIPERAMLGDLIELAKMMLSSQEGLYEELKKLNTERKEIIHGTVGTEFLLKSKVEYHFIEKEGKERELTIDYLKEYSTLARNILARLTRIY